MNRVYAYLRASTVDQDAERAKTELANFISNHDLKISSYFVEYESKLKRPELFRLLEIAESGDILLVEQVDRISRLNQEDWIALKKMILEKGIDVAGYKFYDA